MPSIWLIVSQYSFAEFVTSLFASIVMPGLSALFGYVYERQRLKPPERIRAGIAILFVLGAILLSTFFIVPWLT